MIFIDIFHEEELHELALYRFNLNKVILAYILADVKANLLRNLTDSAIDVGFPFIRFTFREIEHVFLGVLYFPL